MNRPVSRCGGARRQITAIATTYAAVSTSVSGVTLSYRGQVQLANAQFK